MPDPLAKPNRPKPNPLEGAALIIVLSCLVLLAALAIGLLNRVEADRSNASAYRGSTLTRNLAEYAINVVMAQISGATKSDPTLAWASQPGAIRTYSASGSALQNIYKLYSSTNMVVSAFPSGDTNLSGWANNSALFTDLNARVVSGTGSSARTNYPILDPSAVGSVQGFDIIGAPTNSTQPAPMPVNWFYVLEDGTLVPPTTAAGTNTVTVTGASAANPIVGRIAFWTDDDTSKININTASGAPWNYTNTRVTNSWRINLTNTTPANYWDTPMMGSDQDENLAISQPWAGEYQRYPGHPASISLSAVFTNVSSNDIMDIAPRITYQNNTVGSRWGSIVASNTVTSADLGNPTDSTNSMRSPDSVRSSTAYRMADDASRLYANVDELLFATNRSATSTNPITAEQIERARFFLTASSRAPDVTLFNTPRLLVWPITSSVGSTNRMTPYDRLIAFCGTVGANTNIGGTNSYYFTRSDPDSATVDYNVARNQTLLAYFRRMTTQAVPGFDGSSGILGKYNSIAPGESEQITTQIFDYIRCINTRDQSMETNFMATNTTYYFAANRTIMPTAGIATTRGFGRFPTVTKVGMLFWFNNYFTNVVTNAGIPTTNTNVSLCARLLLEPFYASHGYPNPENTTRHRFTISGLDSLRWGTNSDTSTMTRIFPTLSSSNCDLAGSWGWGGRRGISGSSSSWMTQVSATNTNTPAAVFFNSDTTNSVYTNSTFSFSGGTLTINVENDSGSYINQTISVYLPPFSNMQVPRSTYTTNWGNATISSFNGSNAWTSGSFSWTNSVNTTQRSTNLGRLVYTSVTFRPEDVVRSVGVVHGDFRITAARPVVGTNVFAPVNGGVGAYTNTNSDQVIAHNFIGEYPYSYMGGRFPKQNYYNTTNTDFTPGLTTSTVANSGFGPTNATVNGEYQWRSGDAVELTTNTSVTGDWDNGYGCSGNGPYIGFPDEGNSRIYRFIYAKETKTNNSIPYLDGSGAIVSASEGYFSPNRLVPSAGIMGSLPTGVIGQTPWQTLLFRPAALTATNHPGLLTPPDYLLLDLFNMPVVEPYAISEPLSTAGRVNMNYQILPFTYIKRSTALQAALHTEWMLTIPTANGGSKTVGGANITNVYRRPLNLNTNNGTLRGFENRFGSNDIFRSAAEICSIPLVPTNSTWTNVTNTSATGFWAANSGTGDNAKERPYARIYPKLTTKSNTYTVHYRVEVLKKSPNSTAQDTWADGTDKVISTYRGSTTIERYVNPRDAGLPDYASITTLPPDRTQNPLPNFYKFRILGERQFNP